MRKKKQKQIERICQNCKLYNPQREHCSVVVMHEGQRFNLPVDPQDTCFYEDNYFDPTTKAMEDFAGEIQEVKFWVEDENGQRTNQNGTVKIEYPDGFFAPSVDELLRIDAEKERQRK